MIITETGKKLYDYNDVASLMGVCTTTVQKYVRSLGLALIIISGKLHFDESQILQLVEARKARLANGERKKRKTSKK